MNPLKGIPVNQNLESVAVLRKLTLAHQALAELKGVATSIPNQAILVNTLSLQEAKDSSEIENIITTQDELYCSDLPKKYFVSLAAKEVHAYASALRQGVQKIQKHGLLTNAHILDIQASIEENTAGFRKLPGTVLKNNLSGEVVYTPPQDFQEIQYLMTDLESFMNDDGLCEWDVLVKMAVVHHQFESIHPFYDGNGRTGRIINVLYLIQKGLLNAPILYLSRYINQNKSEYYRLLQLVRETADWEPWILFILEGICQTSRQTIRLIHDMKDLMRHHKMEMRTKLPKIYSQDFLNTLFGHPYTKIDRVMSALSVSRLTATRYLEKMVDIGLLSKEKRGRESYYINQALMRLLSQAA